jgi:UDP-N-acetyl-D-galactosamine dehydrogenase
LIGNLENSPKVSAVVLAVAHQLYREWKVHQWAETLISWGVVVDVKGIAPKAALEERKIRVWRL